MRKSRDSSATGLVEVSRAPRMGETEFNGSLINRLPNGDIEIAAGDEGPRIPKEGDFDENLAEYLTAGERQNIAQELLELYEADRESRSDWEMREEVAVELLGIQRSSDHPDSSKKLEFPQRRGHEVTHPLMAEACTQFNARAIAEMFPPEGPVKVTSLGRKRSAAIDDQADRVQAFMNYYLTEVDREYFDDVDSMLFYLSLAGSAFKKVAIDVRTGLPMARYVKAANFVVPYTARSLITAARFHHSYTMVESDVQKAVDIGYFLDQDIQVTGHMGLKSSNKAEDRSDYRRESVPRQENIYDFVESHALFKLPLKYRRNRWDRNEIRPYTFYIDQENNEITRISRAWSKEDTSYRRKRGFVHYKFLPGLGFYGFGYPHLIGSTGRAASGAVNSLLDAATASNFQGGFKTKSGKGMGDVELEHGVYKDIDADYEDLTKTFFNPPFKGPEPAMFQLLTGLVEAGRRFASIQDSQVGAGNNTGPVGTTVALIEEGSRVYTAIHKRLHKAARDEFSILAELIHEYMPQQYPFESEGEKRILMRTDFDGRVDIAPVSDPNIFSSSQRIAIAQNVIALQGQSPDIYTRKQRISAHRMFLRAMRAPDWEELAPEDKRPNNQDPVAENMLMLTGQAVKAFYHQLDEVHMQVHQNFLQLQQGSMDPKEFAQLQATMSAHIREHQANAYRKQIEAKLGIPLPPVDLEDGENEDLPPELEQAISIAVVQHLLTPPPNPEDQQATQEVMDEKARKDAEVIAKIERDTKAWEAEQQRQEQTHQAELRRDDETHQQELEQGVERSHLENIQARAQLAAGIVRDNISTVADIHRKGAVSQHDLQHRERKGQQELSHKARAGSQDLEFKGRTANLSLATGAAKGEQTLSHAEKKAGVELSNRDKAAAQQRNQTELASQQKLRQGDQSAKQDLRHRENLTRQDLKNRGESAKQERAQVRASGQQSRAQSKASHDQGLSQADEKAKLQAKIEERRAQGREVASKVGKKGKKKPRD